jgi:acyl-CoA dehydrogenase
MRRTLFTEEHHLFRDAFKHFLEKEVVPYYEQWEKDGIASREMWLKAGQQGFLGLAVPEDYGRRSRSGRSCQCWYGHRSP